MAVALFHLLAGRELLILEEPLAKRALVLLALAIVAAAIFAGTAPGVTAGAVARAAGSIVASHRGCLLVEKIPGRPSMPSKVVRCVLMRPLARSL